MTDKSELEADFRVLAYCYYSLMEGDVHMIESAMKLLRKYKLTDEDGEWIDE